MYDQGGTVLDVADGAGDDAHHYHAYADIWWWKTSPVDSAHLPPSSLCVRVRGLADDRTAVVSNVVIIPAEQLSSLTLEIQPGQIDLHTGTFQSAP